VAVVRIHYKRIAFAKVDFILSKDFKESKQIAKLDLILCNGITESKQIAKLGLILSKGFTESKQNQDWI
jgi:hypothetical protein